MKLSIFTLSFIIVIAFISCKKEQTCSCKATYVGVADNYEIENDSIITGLKKEEAENICNQGDRPLQTILTESYTVECELK